MADTFKIRVVVNERICREVSEALLLAAEFKEAYGDLDAAKRLRAHAQSYARYEDK